MRVTYLRFWFIVREPHAVVSFGKTLLDLINANSLRFDAHAFPMLAARSAARESAKKRKRGGGKAAPGADQGGEGEGAAQDASRNAMRYTGGESTGLRTYATLLEPTDKGALITSLELLATCMDNVLDRSNVTAPDVLRRVTADKTPWSGNPVHPLFTLEPALFFGAPMPNACSAQRNYRNYYNAAADAWRFPRPDTVVCVPRDMQNVPSLFERYLPAHQARRTAPPAAFDHSREMTAALRIATAPPRLSIVAPPAEEEEEVDWRTVEVDPEEAEDIRWMVGMAGGDAQEAEDQVVVYQKCVARRRTAELAAARGDVERAAPRRLNDDHVDPGQRHGLRPDLKQPFDPLLLASRHFEDNEATCNASMLIPNDAASRSKFHEFVHTGRLKSSSLNDMAAALGPGGDTAEERDFLRAVYLELARGQAVMYAEQCADRTSKVSLMGRLLATWKEQRLAAGGSAWLGRDMPLMDPDMSMFANGVAGALLDLENNAFASTCHLIVFKLFMGLMDAYHHLTGVLHYLALLLGANSTSKTFTLDTLHKMFVDKTSLEMGRTTRAAPYTDDDHNDEILTTDEFPPALIAATALRGGDEAQRTEFKEVTTKNTRTCTTFYQDPSGARRQRKTYSQCINTVAGNSNLTLKDIDPAIASRFDVIPCSPQMRYGRTPADMVSMMRSLDWRAHARIDAWLEGCHATQFLNYHVEKLIAGKALRDVTMAAFDACLTPFNRTLTERFCIPITCRLIERMMMMVRRFTICQALDYVFSHPLSPHFKKDFDIGQLLDLDPLLHDTHEIACFVFTLFRDQMVSRARTVVLSLLNVTVRRAIRATVHAVAAARRSGANIGDAAERARADASYTRTLMGDYLHRDQALRVETAAVATHVAVKDAAPGGARAPPASKFGGASQAAASQPAAEEAASHIGDVDWVKPAQYLAYARVKSSLKMMAMSISKDSAAGELPLSEDEVMSELRSMRDQHFRGRIHTWDHEAGAPRPRTRDDALAAVRQLRMSTSVDEADLADAEALCAPMPALFVNGKDEFFIHLDVLDTKLDPVDEAIRACDTRFVSPLSRNFIQAVPLDVDNPHLLRVRDMHEASAEAALLARESHIVVRNQAAAVTFEMQLRRPDLYGEPNRDTCESGDTRIEYGYDEHSARTRAKALFLDPDVHGRGVKGLCSFERFEAHARTTASDEVRQDTGRDTTYVIKRRQHYPCSLRNVRGYRSSE